MIRARCTLLISLVGAVILAGCSDQAPPRSAPAPAVDDSAAAAESMPSAQPASLAGCEVEAPPTSAPAPAVDDSAAAAESMPSAQPANPALGRGPGMGGDKYDRIEENSFVAVHTDPRSTFSIDVDTASYAKTREFLLEHRILPPPDAVRIEELINYFSYDYAGPVGEHPFAVHVDVAGCPWRPQHRLVRIGLQGKRIERQERPAANLVFLLDVSGSMSSADKLPLVLRGMEMLVEQLDENDRVAIVVYAGAAGLVLDSTSCNRKQEIRDALLRLQAGGSTNGGDGIRLAYRVARENLIQGGTNRVMLCTDGDFNVGTTSSGDLVQLAEAEAKSGVFLSVLGFGTGNLNDAMLEEISNRADGNYGFVDSVAEARKILVDQMSGTLITIAKDVKIQVEFNPAQVQAWRLIGYENRLLAHQDFSDDTKDAGEIGSGHNVTALYEVIPTGIESDVSVAGVGDLKYQAPPRSNQATGSGELLTVELRYKPPQEETSTLMTVPVVDGGADFAAAGPAFRRAAAVALFGMLLRGSEHQGEATFENVLQIARGTVADNASGYREEFVQLVRRAGEISQRQ